MTIDGYSFGKIVIDGKTYTSDLIIYPDRVNASWWRKEGHYLQAADLEEVVREKPDMLIVGTGFWGVMSVPEGTIKFLASKGIEVKVEKTRKAIELFNGMGKDRVVVLALHLTC